MSQKSRIPTFVLSDQASDAWSIAFQRGSQSVAVTFSPTFALRGLHDFQTLEMVLRDVRLRGDSSVKIYKQANVRIRRAAIADLSPLSLYTLRPTLAQLQRLFWCLQAHDQNMFDLTGIVDYSVGSSTYRLAPPIIETYHEPSTNTQVSAIIDGLHRISVAKMLGFEEIWVVDITGVPAHLPPIALPVSWQEVIAYDSVPPTDHKRRYRYSHHDANKKTSGLGITPENYQYYLYRDFSSLGSAGIRTTSNT